MNRRLAASLLAAAVVGGIAAAVVPQHAATIVRVLATAVAVVAGGILLGAVAPFVSRDPPRTTLDSLPSGGAPPLDPQGLRDARRDLDRPAAPGSVPLPVWERLVVAARIGLHGADVASADRTAGTGDPLARTRLSPATRKLLTERPAAGNHRDPAATAAAVHRTLDELTAPTRETGASDGHR